jgi:Protein of unknown function (DUF3500)
MTSAVSRFLAALSPAQREKACFAFLDDAHRRGWSFLPQEVRDGLPIGDLTDDQRKLAHELIVTGTSMPCYAKVVSIMALEHVVRALTAVQAPQLLPLFDPGRYCLSVFGRPGADGPWGWKLDGHHVCLNFTVTEGRLLAPTPCMLGARPATFGVLAPLADDEEAGYRFIRILDERQLREAVIYHRPPPDFATRMVRRIGDVELPDHVFEPEPDYTIDDTERDILSYIRSAPKGLPARALEPVQAAELHRIVEGYAGRLPGEAAGAAMRNIERAGLESLSFAWAGSTEPGERHYFRIQGPELLIEHDNTQGGGNHIHTVWRNPANDFGDDLLERHYQLGHHGAAPQ